MKQTERQIESSLREQIGRDIEVESYGIAAHKALAEVLREKFNGKKLTKRIEGYFLDKFFINAPELKEKAIVRYSDEHEQCKLQVWNVCCWKSFDQRLSMFICHKDKAGAFSPEDFESEDRCHASPAEERNKARAAFCQGEEIKRVAAIVAQMDSLRAELEQLTEHGKPGYCCSYYPEVNRQREFIRY